MSCIDDVFRQKNAKALIAYVTMGYPSIEATMKVVPLLAAGGCDIVELGIPFSDSLADGATIQQASFCALQNGVTPQHCLEMVRGLRKEVNIPLVFMTYYNPVFKYGIEKFCCDSAESGVNGIIVPDLPPDEGLELEVIASKEGIDLIYLLAPTSTEERIELVARHSRGFIYLVSVTGTTGARQSLTADLDELVARIKMKTSKPLCVGFGISTSQQAGQVARVADGVIVGSQIIQLMQAEDDFASVCSFIKGLRQAIDKSPGA
jgi:tryptophan synthase alpha chain